MYNKIGRGVPWEESVNHFLMMYKAAGIPDTYDFGELEPESNSGFIDLVTVSMSMDSEIPVL